MDELLLEAFRATTYLVVIDTLTWATVRIDLPPPVELLAVAGTRPWGIITAWNPQARRRAPAENLAAQRQLLAALQASPEAVVLPAIGVGPSGWSEPSLFVAGVAVPTLDTLAREHAQLAYVHGLAGNHAELRVLD